MKIFNKKAPERDLVKTLLSRGDEARDQKNWRGAAEAYKTALEHRPELTDIWVQYGHALKEAGDDTNAVTAYRRALEQKPEDAETHIHLAHLLKRLKRFDEAISAFGTALDLNPNDTPIRDEMRALMHLAPSSLHKTTSSISAQTPINDTTRTALIRERNAALAEIAKLKAEKNEWDRSGATRLQEVQARLDSAHAETRQVQDRFAGQQAQLTDHVAEISTLKTQLAEIKAARDALFNERNAAREEVAALKPLKGQLEETARSQHALQSERDAAETEVAELKSQVAEWEKSSAARQAAAQALYEEAQRENELFKEQIAGQQAELEAQQAQLTDHVAEISTLKTQLAEIKAARDALFNERNAAREEAAALKPLKGQLEETARSQHALQSERDTAETEVAELKSQVAEWEKSSAARQDEVDILTKELSKVKAEREGLFQERNAARVELETKQTEVESRATQVAEAEAARKEALAQAETARKEARNYEVRVNMAREEFLRSEGQIALIKDLVLREDSL